MLRAALVAVALASPVQADDAITAARYSEPTTRYGHAILGDAVEWGALVLSVGTPARTVTIRLPESRVFEDLSPRLIEGEGGEALVMVVETDLSLGARLALYDGAGLHAATPFIGRTHRWLAPIGAADLDGDGSVEVAYIDRPHLAKTLRIWRLKDGKLTHVMDQSGLTNHRIGDDTITGGLRDCGQGAEMVTVDANWQQIMVSRFDGARITSRRVAPYKSEASLRPVMACTTR